MWGWLDKWPCELRSLQCHMLRHMLELHMHSSTSFMLLRVCKLRLQCLQRMWDWPDEWRFQLRCFLCHLQLRHDLLQLHLRWHYICPWVHGLRWGWRNGCEKWTWVIPLNCNNSICNVPPAQDAFFLQSHRDTNMVVSLHWYSWYAIKLHRRLLQLHLRPGLREPYLQSTIAIIQWNVVVPVKMDTVTERIQLQRMRDWRWIWRRLTVLRPAVHIELFNRFRSHSQQPAQLAANKVNRYVACFTCQ